VVIANGRLTSGSAANAAPRVRTGPDGRYAFRPQGHRVAVIAVHDAGFAFRSADEPAAATDLTLEPWAHIEGTFRIAATPAPGKLVVVRLRTPGVMATVQNKILTDGSGRFVLDRVAPGRITVFHRVDTPNQGWTLSHPLYGDVKPGENLRVQIGGTGRPVVGRLAIPEGIELSQFDLNQNALGHGALAPVLPEPPTPDDFLEYNSEQRAVWWESFSRTAKGRAYVEERDQSYVVELRPDGTFRAEDVPSGRYVLKLPFE